MAVKCIHIDSLTIIILYIAHSVYSVRVLNWDSCRGVSLKITLLGKQSKFPRYNMKCIEENQILHAERTYTPNPTHIRTWSSFCVYNNYTQRNFHSFCECL